MYRFSVIWNYKDPNSLILVFVAIFNNFGRKRNKTISMLNTIETIHHFILCNNKQNLKGL